MKFFVQLSTRLYRLLCRFAELQNNYNYLLTFRFTLYTEQHPSLILH